MTSSIILDASALLAVLNQEPGSEELASQAGSLGNWIISTVNLAEAYGKLVSRGVPATAAWQAVTDTVRHIVPFEIQHAKQVGDLLSKTAKQGLSLGDRACLALGLILKLPVYTTDRAWTQLDLPLKIHLLRGATAGT